MSCKKCNITFATKSNERRHMKKFHPEEELKIRKNQICSECSFKSRTLSELHSHIEKTHSDIKLKFETHYFYSQKDFEEWKVKIEKETVSFYTLKGTKRTCDGKINQYQCNRSGQQRCQKTERKKHSKSTGSVKTGVTCPASMRVTIKSLDGIMEMTVKFCSTHTGHTLDARKLRLTKDERTSLASILDTGVPANKVLDIIQDSCSTSDRYSLTKKKDLYNIVRDFQLAKSVHRELVINLEDLQTEKEVIKKQLHKKSKIEVEDKRKVLFSRSISDRRSILKRSISDKLMSLQINLKSINSSEDLDYLNEQLENACSYLESKKKLTLPVPKCNAPVRILTHKRGFKIKRNSLDNTKALSD